MHNTRKRLLAGPYLVWIIGFTVLPILMILYYAFTNSDGGFTWANIAAIADPVHIKALLLSLKLGILCTVVCLLLSYPLAMILNSLHIKHQSFVVFSTYPQGNNRCGKGFRCQQFYHLLPYHSAAYCAWNCQWNYYGIRTGTYLLCYFRPFRRR